ncbi:MAG: DUF2244 domain-containing protein [Alphaproteobacteria bacterium]|nr:DUF2244 domain-containing protein [Alphaproteobacteria bacterium]
MDVCPSSSLALDASREMVACHPPVSISLFDTVLTPHQSLPDALWTPVAATIALVALASQALLLLADLGIVAAFVGLDAAGLLVALAVSRRHRRRSERIIVAAGRLERTQYDWQGPLFARDYLPLFGLRLEVVDDPDHGLLSLAACLRNQRLVLGRDLSPGERQELIDGLTTALARDGLYLPVHRQGPCLHGRSALTA